MILHSSLINAVAIALGSLFGILMSRFFDKSRRLKKLPDALMKAVSLCVIVIGVKGAIFSEKFLIVLISLVVGTIIGSVIKIDHLLKKFGDFIERKLVSKKAKETKTIESSDPITSNNAGDENQKSFSKGFVATTLTCCVGAMAITGALEAGMNVGHNILYTKSILDFITAIVYGSAFGIGSALASIPLFIYQGAIALSANALSSVLEQATAEISAVGSVIVIGLGLNMLGVSKIKVANMLPAVFLPSLLCLFM